MDASMATFQARLETFQGAPAAKSRRSSSRSKKTTSKAKAAWPLAAPSAEDLAFAGFVWRPTSVSPDNVQCWACNCQLDGWEEADVPAYEHLTHSPSCGLAVVTAIRLRHGDPGRTEEDPISEKMIAARKETFGDLWPLDASAGYPSVDQLAEAGWFYDPTEGNPDGATCPYCHLSLDAWDAGDDPFEEHRRRASDCLFFALTELYHPVAPEPKKAKRATKGKRASSRSSIASNAASTTAPKKKATRAKKRASEAIDDTHMSEAPVPKKKAGRAKKVASDSMDDTQMSEATGSRSTRGRKRASEAIDDTQMSKATTRGRKRASEAIDDTQLSKATTRGRTRISDATDDSELPKAKPRGKKRTSEVIEDVMQVSEIHHDTSKRMRFSSMSSLPDDLNTGTPKNQPTAEIVTEPFTMSSLPGSVLTGTPKRTPAHMREAEVNKTPSPKQVEDDENNGWKPTDMDAFFGNQEDVQGFFNGILIDAGLDELTVAGTTPKDIQAAVLAALTDEEKAMTIEQWVLYNAQRGEEKLRRACEQQIAAFREEGRRALAQLQAIPTH